MTLSDLIYEIVKSTASALTWAILGWLILAVRNWNLERSLRKTFGNHGIATGVDGMGITLNNPTAYDVIVRKVSAQQEERGSFILNYNGPKEEVTSRNYVTLPPFSDGEWLLPRTLYQFQKSDFTSISVEFLYPSLFGSLKQVTIKCDDILIDGFNKIRNQDIKEMARLAGTGTEPRMANRS